MRGRGSSFLVKCIGSFEEGKVIHAGKMQQCQECGHVFLVYTKTIVTCGNLALLFVSCTRLKPMLIIPSV